MSYRWKPIARVIEARRGVVAPIPLPVSIHARADGRVVAAYGEGESPPLDREFDSLDELLAFHGLTRDEIEELRPIVIFPMRVLVVDDEHTGHCVLDRSLLDAGFRPSLVTSSAAASASLAGRRPAAIVLDVGLRDGGGERLLSLLSERASAPPTVVVSAHPSALKIADRYGLETVDKPCVPGVLVRAIERAIRTHRKPRRASDLA